MDLYYADPAQPLTTAGEYLDDLDRDLSDLSVRRVKCFVNRKHSIVSATKHSEPNRESLSCVTFRYMFLRVVMLEIVALRYITFHYVMLHFVALCYVSLRYVTFRCVVLRFRCGMLRFVGYHARHKAFERNIAKRNEAKNGVTYRNETHCNVAPCDAA